METNPDIIETNRARLTGELLKDLDFSHRTYGEAFYETLIGVERSSGYRDEIRLQISERLLLGLCLGAGSRVDVRGQVRTYNEETDGRSKLNIVVFAREISEIPEDEQLFTKMRYISTVISVKHRLGVHRLLEEKSAILCLRSTECIINRTIYHASPGAETPLMPECSM